VTKTIPKIIYAVLIMCIVLGAVYGIIRSNIHPDPAFVIGNGFSELVTVYFNGKKMGTLQPEQVKTFYPNEATWTADEHMLMEFKSKSDVALYSKNFSWYDFQLLGEQLKGQPYWIGKENQSS
jgi:hypothetical protein